MSPCIFFKMTFLISFTLLLFNCHNKSQSKQKALISKMRAMKDFHYKHQWSIDYSKITAHHTKLCALLTKIVKLLTKNVQMHV